MRNILLILILAVCLCAAGCTTYLKKPVEEVEPVQFPVSRFLTLSQEQLLFLDWRIAYKGGAHLKDEDSIRITQCIKGEITRTNLKSSR